MPALKEYLQSRQKIVDSALNKFLLRSTAKPAVIHESIRYSMLAGGKRLRPILVMAAAEMCGKKATDVLPVACGMEMIHTYSLIHDDLPAMDDDDLRRGKPTNHVVYGEDIAILAGDALLTQAFETMALNAGVKGIKPKAVVQAIGLIAKAAGSTGMVGGQVADVQSDKGRWKKNLNPQFKDPKQLLRFIHLNKTAALIKASLEAGAVLAGATPAQIKALRTYAECIGLAFQVKDDILDRIGDKKKLGKSGSDEANEKLTYPVLYGMEQSFRALENLRKEAHTSLKPFKAKSFILDELAEFVVNRDH